MKIENHPSLVNGEVTLLAIDTATESCSAALLHKGKLTSIQTETPRSHTEKILPMVDTLLTTASISLSALDAIVFGEGPGSFTGVRVGVSVAQGLGFGANIPLIGVSNLLALAQGAFRKSGHSTVISAIDARMSEIYIGGFHLDLNSQTWSNFLPEQVISPEKIITPLSLLSGVPQSIVAGTGFITYPELLSNELITHIFSETVTNSIHTLPHAVDMISLGLHDFINGQVINANIAEPTYLRNEVTWQKLPGK